MTDLNVAIERHRRSGIAVDSNLLLLFIVGIVDRAFAARFKRTRMFAKEDFELLTTILGHFDKRFVTPHVLTEVSNFVGQMSGPHCESCRATLAEIVRTSCEHSTIAANLVETTEYYTFGLTDASISDLASRQLLVLTVDAPLASFLRNKGLAAVNLHHVRATAWRP